MPKKERSQETKDLEDQLGGMILGNVRISSDNAAQERSPRGRGRGRGSGHHGYVPPHLRHVQDGTAPTSPGAHNANGPLSSPEGPISPQGALDRRQQSFGRTQDFRGGRGQGFSGYASRGRGAATHGQTPSQTLFNPHDVPRPARGPQHQHNNSTSARPPRQPPVPPMAAFIAQCEMLDKLAAVEIPKVEMSQHEFVEKDTFRMRLEIICREEVAAAFPELASRLDLRAYGSIVSGFATQGSDLDLTIVWSGPVRDDAEFKAQLPRVVENAILKAHHGARLLSRTRVPIVKVCQLPHEDLYTALVEEREKWEALPLEEKYPSLAPRPDSPVDDTHTTQHDHPLELDPDLSRSGKKMETPTTKKITMSEDPLAFLLQLKSKPRTEDDDLARYCTSFINARRFALQSSPDTDDTTFTEWFLEGLPASVTQLMAEDRALQLRMNAAYMGKSLFEQYYEVAHPIIARLDSSKSKRGDKPWLREKALGKLDFPKHGVGIQCDINFSNPLGMHNTELLRLYSLCDPRVRPMILFVKSWAKRRKINSAYSGTLSSYGYVLMVLHFLINIVTPPVLPNLQHVFGAAERREVFVDRDTGAEYNIAFHRDEAHIRHLAATGRWTQNTEPLGVLLRNFFHYYAAQGSHVIGTGFNWMRDVISIRTPPSPTKNTPGGLLTKEEKGWTGAKTVTMDGGREVRQRYLLAIEDPFETEHNVGRPVTHNGIVTVRDEFRRAWRILGAVGRGAPPEGGLFDAVVEKVKEEEGKQDTDAIGAPQQLAGAELPVVLPQIEVPHLGGYTLSR